MGSRDVLLRGQRAVDALAKLWLAPDVVVGRFSDVDQLHRFQWLLSPREREVLAAKTQQVWQTAPQIQLSAPVVKPKNKRLSDEGNKARSAKAKKNKSSKAKGDEDMSATYALFD